MRGRAGRHCRERRVERQSRLRRQWIFDVVVVGACSCGCRHDGVAAAAGVPTSRRGLHEGPVLALQAPVRTASLARRRRRIHRPPSFPFWRALSSCRRKEMLLLYIPQSTNPLFMAFTHLGKTKRCWVIYVCGFLTKINSRAHWVKLVFVACVVQW